MPSVTADSSFFYGNVRNQNEIHQAFRAVWLKNADQPARGRQRDKIRMLNPNMTAIRKMNNKRPKRFGMAELSDLLNCHDANLTDDLNRGKATKKTADLGQRVLQNPSSINVC